MNRIFLIKDSRNERTKKVHSLIGYAFSIHVKKSYINFEIKEGDIVLSLDDYPSDLEWFVLHPVHGPIYVFAKHLQEIKL